ncbi:lmo0937 family membrane protein [Maribacter confluentis]|uniref:Lmo0937 family membrane protein n=1 Tax=Maribacter confluentis TaxID=1656093 RepID=A0ABT8RMR1_9FLAO|nr:lmo0937 family membrane protein [Maribacter confluentis]MDO1512215.1 lmo0937 family membrane protein [Maribacter confluentis]
MKKILWTIIVILVIGWMLGFLVFKILGAVIHILLVLAIVLAVYNWLNHKNT